MGENLAFLVNLTLVTLCIIGPFLYCYLLYLIIYLVKLKKLWNKTIFEQSYECLMQLENQFFR